MTFGVFKQLIKANTLGELTLSDDDVIKELLNSAIISDIADKTT